MKKLLRPGISHKVSMVVSVNESAIHVGSGSLQVFSTPSMIALMEKAALEAVAGYLEEGKGTVGSLVNVSHIRPSPIGAEIICVARLDEIEGRKLKFSVEASDANGPIGSGIHERYIIDELMFMSKIKS